MGSYRAEEFSEALSCEKHWPCSMYQEKIVCIENVIFFLCCCFNLKGTKNHKQFSGLYQALMLYSFLYWKSSMGNGKDATNRWERCMITEMSQIWVQSKIERNKIKVYFFLFKSIEFFFEESWDLFQSFSPSVLPLYTIQMRMWVYTLAHALMSACVSRRNQRMQPL